MKEIACGRCGHGHLETDAGGEWRWTCRLAERGAACAFVSREREPKPAKKRGRR